MGARTQVMEVVIRQAAMGAPWRELCKGPMAVNNISIAEVERHVEFRQKRDAGLLPGIAQEEQAAYGRFINKWRETAASVDGIDREEIRSTTARLCRILGVAPAPVVFCQSPFQLKLYPELLKHNVRSREGLLEIARTNRTLASSLEAVEESVSESLWQNLFEQTGSAGFVLPGDLIEERASVSAHPGPIWSYIHENLKDEWFLVAVSLPQALGRVLEPLRQLIRLSFFTAGVVLDGSMAEPGAAVKNTPTAGVGFAEPRIFSAEEQMERFTFAQLEGIAAPEPWTPVNAVIELCCKFARDYNGRDLLQGCNHRHWMELMEARAALAAGAPACAYRRGIFYICERPLQLHYSQPMPFQNDSRQSAGPVDMRPPALRMGQTAQLHNEVGPAIKFSDGLEIYAFNGVAVPRNLIEHPEAITIPRIVEVQNAEIRRVMIERYGLSRYIVDSGANLIHEDETGRLFRKEHENDEPLVMVQVLNSTAEPDGSFKHYFLRVPPRITTAKEAVAWTFGMASDHYKPAVES